MWVEELFGVKKPILAMCHLAAMPTDPKYDAAAGIEAVVERARQDIKALQEGGVDGIIFSNEYSLPYLSEVKSITVATMARVITELKDELTVPFGVDVISDIYASLDLAVVTGAKYIRGVMSGSFVSVVGSINLNPGDVVRYQHSIGADDVKVFSYVVPEGSEYLGKYSLGNMAKKMEFSTGMDVMLVAGLIAGSPTDTQSLSLVKQAVKTPVFVNTGCKKETITDQLKIADGAIVATTFKYDGIFENMVDENRVKEFMDTVKEYRKKEAVE